MQVYTQRECLEGLEMEIFKLVSYSATPEQWEEWLRVPLEHAAARGNLDLFNKLLGAGADGGAGWRGCRGRTLLDAAAGGGNVDVVSGLLRAGSRHDLNVTRTSNSRRSPLYTATSSGHEAVARRLVVAGADVNVHDPIDDWSVLHEAVRGGHAELVDFLLMNGANADAYDGHDGASPLHIAADEGFDGIVSTLLLRGADKDALDNQGSTPVMGASVRGHASVVETLLTAGANFNTRSETGAYSALDLAAEEGHVAVLEVLLGHGADANARDNNGYTALHTAAECDQVDAVNALIKAGAGVDLESDDGATPLAIAASRSQLNAMLALRQHGATVDVRHKEGNTPLHLACLRRCEGLYAAVELLLRWGHDEISLNEAGCTPADMLHAAPTVDGECHECSQDEIERARRLLARAPFDRAWRRRCWLVMLRARASEARAASVDASGNSAGDTIVAGDRSEGQRVDSCGGAIGADGTGGEISDDLAAFLLELGSEGVFRTVVSFL